MDGTDDSDVNNNGGQKQSSERKDGGQKQSQTGPQRPAEQGSNIEHVTPRQQPRETSSDDAEPRAVKPPTERDTYRRPPPPAHQTPSFRR